MDTNETINLRSMWIDDIKERKVNNDFILYFQNFAQPVRATKNNILHYLNIFNVRDKIAEQLFEFFRGILPKLADGERLNVFEIATLNTIVDQYNRTLPMPEDFDNLRYIMRTHDVQRELWSEDI